MIVKNNGNAILIKGTPDELRDFKTKFNLADEDGLLVLSGDIPRDGYYKEHIESLTKERDSLTEQVNKLERFLGMAKEKIENQNNLIRKLKEALVEAAIK